MKAILHIGTPKTASTYLQNVMAQNRPELRRHGIVYPHLLRLGADHITLFCAAQPYLHPFQREYGITSREEIAPFRDRLRAQLRKEADANPDAVFVMSSENLSGNLAIPAGIVELRAILREVFDDIRIVVYLRRQDKALLSMYAEYMRRGFSARTFDAYIERNLKQKPNVTYIDYKHQVGHWARIFGRANVVPRIFDPARFTGGSLLSDFLSLICDTPDQLAARLSPVEAANISLAAPVLEFLRVLQPLVPFQLEGGPNPERARLLPRINALPSEPRPAMSRAQSDRIMAHFEEGNQVVAQTYFPDLSGSLFPDSTDLTETSNLGELSLEQFKTYFRAVFD